MAPRSKPPSLNAKFVERFEKSFGAGSLIRGNVMRPYEVIPTGSINLDHAVGIGGYPEGRICQWWGPADVGKTSMVLLAAAEAQRKYPKRMVGYIDVEHKLDQNQAELLGVDLSRLYLTLPETAEQTADQVAMMVGESDFSMVAVDSIGAMIGKVEQEKNADEATVAIVAKIVTRLVKASNSLAARHGTCIHLINQIRSNIESGNPHAPKTSLPGGWALRFQSSLSFKLRYTKQTPYVVSFDGEIMPVGRQIAIEVERNKCSAKGRTAMVQLISVASDQFGPVGIDRADEAVTLGVNLGLIKHSSSWYTLPGASKPLQGQPAAVAALRADPDALEALRLSIVATRAHETTDDLGQTEAEVEVMAPVIDAGSKRSAFVPVPEVAS